MIAKITKATYSLRKGCLCQVHHCSFKTLAVEPMTAGAMDKHCQTDCVLDVDGRIQSKHISLGVAVTKLCQYRIYIITNKFFFFFFFFF